VRARANRERKGRCSPSPPFRPLTPLSCAQLKRAFSDYACDFGPNDFFVMQKGLKEESPNPSLKSVCALLKLGDWDPDVFYKFRDVILNQVCQANAKLRNDLCRGIPRVWEN
jgi:hypothetical protein